MKRRGRLAPAGMVHSLYCSGLGETSGRRPQTGTVIRRPSFTVAVYLLKVSRCRGVEGKRADWPNTAIALAFSTQSTTSDPPLPLSTPPSIDRVSAYWIIHGRLSWLMWKRLFHWLQQPR